MNNESIWICPVDNTANPKSEKICLTCGYAQPKTETIAPPPPPSQTPSIPWKIIAFITISILIVFLTVAAIYNSNLSTTNTQSGPSSMVGGVTQVVTVVTNLVPTSTVAPTQMNLDVETNRSLVFGPGEGDLLMKDRLQIDSPNKSVSLKNFSTEVVFTNPYSSSTGKWDYGIIFRSTGQKQLFLLLRSDNKWAIVREDATSMKISSQGSIANLKTEQGESNTVKLVCKDSSGWLYINGELIREFDLPDGYDAGSISVGSGFFQEDRISGKSTHYANWQIWSLEE